jgi:hypothetical protein
MTENELINTNGVHIWYGDVFIGHFDANGVIETDAYI